tara:strand:- start:254 stop:919 length:666 start_codon:yes stop_codon:yes gene_type:complete
MKLLTRKKPSEIELLFNKNKPELEFVKDFMCVYKKKQTLNCEEIISHAESLEGWEESTCVGEDLTCLSPKVEPEHRDSSQLPFDATRAPLIHKQIFDFSQEALNDFLSRFPEANKFPSFRIRESYQVIRYKEGQAFHGLHSDYFPFKALSRRHLTGIIFLNDIKEGGELFFPHQDLTMKSERGKMVIFPSGWTHVHKTFPPVNQTRYVFQMWWSFENEGED